MRELAEAVKLKAYYMPAYVEYAVMLKKDGKSDKAAGFPAAVN